MIQKLRILSFVIIHILILLHVFYWGDDVIGSVDYQEFFHSFLKYGIVNAGVLLVILSFIFTLIFGRFFCGWACHFGAIQELAWFVLKKININPTTVDSKLVTFLPLLILMNLYVIPNLFFAMNNPWDLSVKINEPEIWAFLPGFFIGTTTFIIDGFLIVYFLGKKGFCRFICPWGAFLKIPNSLALFKVRKTGNCTNCYNCTDSCPIGIDVNYEINEFKKVTNTNCTSCMLCVSGCPSSALSYSYKNPLKEDISLLHYIPTKNKINSIISQPNIFQSIRHKDWVFLIITLLFATAINGFYGIGHFLAYGIAIICSFVVIKNQIQLKYIQYSFNVLIFILFFWHALIKINIYSGAQYYDTQSPTLIQKIVKVYAQKMGKY